MKRRVFWALIGLLIIIVIGGFLMRRPDMSATAFMWIAAGITALASVSFETFLYISLAISIVCAVCVAVCAVELRTGIFSKKLGPPLKRLNRRRKTR